MAKIIGQCLHLLRFSSPRLGNPGSAIGDPLNSSRLDVALSGVKIIVKRHVNYTPCIRVILLADCPYHAMPTSGFHQKSVGENGRQSVSKYSSSKCVRWVVQVIAMSYLMTKQKWT